MARMNPKSRRIYDLLEFNKKKRSCLSVGSLLDCLAIGLDPQKLKSKDETLLKAARIKLRAMAFKAMGRAARNIGDWQRVLVKRCKIVVFSAANNFNVCFAGESKSKMIGSSNFDTTLQFNS